MSKFLTRRQSLMGLAAAATLVFRRGALAQPAGGEATLRIGVLGVMRGPAASWGLVNKYCAEVTAQMYNEQGGVEVAGKR